MADSSYFPFRNPLKRENSSLFFKIDEEYEEFEETFYQDTLHSFLKKLSNLKSYQAATSLISSISNLLLQHVGACSAKEAIQIDQKQLDRYFLYVRDYLADKGNNWC